VIGIFTPRGVRNCGAIQNLPFVFEMVGRLDGKVAIVTGGCSGFGFGITQKFLEEGAKVLILDINENSPKFSSEDVKFIRGDVSSRADWERALDTVLHEFGKLDTVVNNAGILIVKVRITHVSYGMCS
jgi:NAD(P)-dependent dehydrogenase (short-subunit alcohol dehydrogenase family)